VTPDLLITASFVVVAILTFSLVQAVCLVVRQPPGEQFEPGEAELLGLPESGRKVGPVTESLARLFPQTTRGKQALEMAFIRAGRFSRSAPIRYLAVRNLLITISVLLTAALAVVIGPGNDPLVLRILGVGLAVSVFCWAVPKLMLQAAGARRVERIRRSLPYVLDMISMCITGGASLRDALGHVSREINDSHPETAVELAIVREQGDLASLEFGLSQFSIRMDLPEVAGLSGLVTQLDRLGVGAETALQGYSDSMRQKWRQQADERANTKTVKLLFPLAVCLLPSMMILLWGPAAVDLFRFLKEGGLSSVRQQVTEQDGLNSARERVRTAQEARARAAPAPRQ
jgi:tight adherence protein C